MDRGKQRVPSNVPNEWTNIGYRTSVNNDPLPASPVP